MKKKILLIEDDEAVLRPLSAAMKRGGFKLLIARDGEEGLEILRKELPDLILLDLVLPKISGFEMLKEIKNNLHTKKIPIIILSNLAREEEIQRGLSGGAEEYFVKTNFSLSALTAKIKKSLE